MIKLRIFGQPKNIWVRPSDIKTVEKEDDYDHVHYGTEITLYDGSSFFVAELPERVVKKVK